MFNKSLITILLVGIVVFCMALYALLMQVFGIDNTNKATIISGVLGFLGGLIGALGAYAAAITQTKKQFKQQQEERKLQMRTQKYDDISRVLNLLLTDMEHISKGFTEENSRVSTLHNMVICDVDVGKENVRFFEKEFVRNMDTLLNRITEHIDTLYIYNVYVEHLMEKDYINKKITNKFIEFKEEFIRQKNSHITIQQLSQKQFYDDSSFYVRELERLYSYFNNCYSNIKSTIKEIENVIYELILEK